MDMNPGSSVLAVGMLQDVLGAVKRSGKAIVEYVSSPGLPPGYNSYAVLSGGLRGYCIAAGLESEDAAWMAAALHLSYLNQGELVMVSREFGPYYHATLLDPDGSLGMLGRRHRLEVLKVGGGYDVLHVVRAPDEHGRLSQVSQTSLGVRHADLGAVTSYVARYIENYEGIALENWLDAQAVAASEKSEVFA